MLVRVKHMAKKLFSKLDIPFKPDVLGLAEVTKLSPEKTLLFVWNKIGNQAVYEILLNKSWCNNSLSKSEIRDLFDMAIGLGHIPISIEVNNVSYFFRDYCPEYIVIASKKEAKLIKHHGHV